MLPHLLPELEIFDFTFWFDDKLPSPPESSVLQAVNLLEKLSLPFALSEHPEPSSNILLELQRAQRQPRYLMQNQQMIDYITRELENGGRLSRSALYQGGLILRNMRHGRVRSFNEDWYTRSQQCGIEDQLSLNFVTEEFEFAPLYRWY
jgi:hypothetical protein